MYDEIKNTSIRYFLHVILLSNSKNMVSGVDVIWMLIRSHWVDRFCMGTNTGRNMYSETCVPFCVCLQIWLNQTSTKQRSVHNCGLYILHENVLLGFNISRLFSRPRGIYTFSHSDFLVRFRRPTKVKDFRLSLLNSTGPLQTCLTSTNLIMTGFTFKYVLSKSLPPLPKKWVLGCPRQERHYGM